MNRENKTLYCKWQVHIVAFSSYDKQFEKHYKSNKKVHVLFHDLIYTASNLEYIDIPKNILLPLIPTIELHNRKLTFNESNRIIDPNSIESELEDLLTELPVGIIIPSFEQTLQFSKHLLGYLKITELADSDFCAVLPYKNSEIRMYRPPKTEPTAKYNQMN